MPSSFPTTKTGKRIFPGISPLSYEHPTDAAALEAMRKVPGIDKILRLFFRLVHEKRTRLLFLSSTVRVNEKQFGNVYELYREAREILDMEEEPELFVAQTPILNAFAFGIDKPFIVLNSSTLDTLDEKELQAILAHELAHVLSGHMLYKSVLFTLLELMQMGGFGIPFGIWGLRAFVIALFEWYRKSELSCDRAALLVTQDLDVCLKVEMKLAGGRKIEHMDTEEFLKQAEEYEEAGDILDSIYKLLNMLYTTHPYAVVRMKELKEWYENGSYNDILAGTYTKREDDAHARMRDQLKEAAKKYRQDLKGSGDTLAKFFSGVTNVGENIISAGGDFFEKIFGQEASEKSEKDSKDDTTDSSSSTGATSTSARDDSDDDDTGSDAQDSGGWKSWPSDEE
ncbi:M48 family metallopeptidase [Candidatus Riflebacteria bacterium]